MKMQARTIFVVLKLDQLQVTLPWQGQSWQSLTLQGVSLRQLLVCDLMQFLSIHISSGKCRIVMLQWRRNLLAHMIPWHIAHGLPSMMRLSDTSIHRPSSSMMAYIHAMREDLIRLIRLSLVVSLATQEAILESSATVQSFNIRSS